MAGVTKAELEQEIVALIQEFSTADDVTVEMDATFDQLSVSSLDVLQIIFRIEEAHGISIETDSFHEVKTVGDVVDYVAKAVG